MLTAKLSSLFPAGWHLSEAGIQLCAGGSATPTTKEIIHKVNRIYLRRCGGSVVARQTFGAEVPGSNLASPTMILGGAAGSLCNTVKSQGREGALYLSYLYRYFVLSWYFVLGLGPEI